MRSTKKFMTDYEIEMELDEALEEYSGENTPVNLSYWNSCPKYKVQMKKILKLDNVPDIFDYHYYFPEEIKDIIVQKLGFSAQDREKAFFHALSQSTLSIVVTTALLLKLQVKMGIILPSYFSVPDCCDDLKVPVRVFDSFLPDINRLFDLDLLMQSDCNAFWFTSPINSSSIYFTDQVKNGIQKLLDAGKIIILDESLCENGRELSYTFGIQENLIYIYSPHKALGIQGIKFSALVAHKKYYDTINSMIDSYGGSLSYSSQQGMFHFASKNYDDCLSLYKKFWNHNLSAARKIVASYSFATILPETAGHYTMIFTNRKLKDIDYINAMKNLMKEKGYFIYPGSMHGFDSKKHFCFRINLLLETEILEQGLKVVLDYLKDNSEADR